MTPARCLTLMLLFVAAAPATVAVAAVSGYYRQPALAGEQLVFVSEGDLWRAGAAGGLAQRLTSHPARAANPAISPDGRWIAFDAGYDGAQEVYAMPSGGGAPRRLSFEGGVRVAGWTPAGEVLYAAPTRAGSHWVLRAVDPVSLARRELPLLDAHQATHDEAGRIFFVRFGLSLTGDNARGYRGGAMAQLWRFVPGSGAEAERLAADHPGNLESPMWWQGRLYVVSDASGSANLWRFDADGGDARQLTFHEDFEVRGASLGDGRIVYQLGADIRRYDVASGEDTVIELRLASDRAATRERWLREPLKFLDQVGFAPNGERALIIARGQLALAGTGALRRSEPLLPPESRVREAVASADGRHVFALLDRGGEQAIWRIPADGSPGAVRVAGDGDTQRGRLALSPDDRLLAYADRRGRLWLLDTGSGRERIIDQADGDGHADLAWSPDGRLLAFARSGPTQRAQLAVIEVASGRRELLTSDRYESFAPAFSADGRWLFFLSHRNFEATPASPWGDRNLGPMFDRRARIYGLALQPGNRFPLAPRDEFTPAKPSEAAASLPAAVLDGLGARLHEAPLPPGNYRALAAGKDRLYLLDQAATRGTQPVLQTVAFEPDQAKLETFAENVAEFALSADRSRLLMRRGGESPALFIVSAAAKAPDRLEDSQVRLGDWRLAVRPQAEWRQMFHDAWRMQRDFLFDAAMRGQDWEALRARHAPLVERIGERGELDDLLAQMVAHLGVLHSQVRGGDFREDLERPEPAFLGGEFERVPEGARILRVWHSDPELPAERAPLARPGVDLAAGDIITAVNGRPVAEVDDIAELLKHTAGQQVRLDYRRGRETGSVVTVPVDAGREATLRYSDWVHGNRERVQQAGSGRIGYLHLRAMGTSDIADFAREFYANIDREGLIIDVRRNRGGNIDSWVIEKLLRRAWAFWQSPHQAPFWNMQQTFRGHLVVLIDPLTYSDGETFAAGVKSLGLAPLIGQRTAGAGVWLSDRNRLADRGLMRAAEWGQFDPEGRWLIEGAGVAPDIEVENPPHAAWRGEDAQLARALSELKARMREAPVGQPPAQPIPPQGQVGADARRM
jgi:tricorn protease